MRQRTSTTIRHLLFCLSFISYTVNCAWAQIAPGLDQSDFECIPGTSPWSCYGSMEAVISIELDTSSKVMPLFRSRVVKFTNREVLIESEQFYSDRDGERKLASYFLARPSMVALATGWDTWEMPARGPTRVTGELQRISEILQAAFPTGPATVSDKWQTVIAKVKEYVHPTGELTENKAITAGKAPDGLVFFYYKGVGEPMGPYQVSGIWNPAQPKPWSDNHLIPYAGISAKQRFETLGQVRAYVPAP